MKKFDVMPRILIIVASILLVVSMFNLVWCLVSNDGYVEKQYCEDGDNLFDVIILEKNKLIMIDKYDNAVTFDYVGDGEYVFVDKEHNKFTEETYITFHDDILVAKNYRDNEFKGEVHMIEVYE